MSCVAKITTLGNEGYEEISMTHEVDFWHTRFPLNSGPENNG
jgi:hypothetical protein